MATPASGAISMNNMNTEITRASATAQISMSTVRTRYGGGTSAISFNDLRACEGFTANPTQLSTKFTVYEGWQYRFNAHGSVSPNESSGILVAANSYIIGMNASTPVANSGWSNSNINLADGPSGVTTGGIAAGWRGTDITRVVTANVSRTLGWQTATIGTAYYTYNWPTSGTIHCLVKF